MKRGQRLVGHLRQAGVAAHQRSAMPPQQQPDEGETK
jgi:hypothetical protein